MFNKIFKRLSGAVKPVVAPERAAIEEHTALQNANAAIAQDNFLVAVNSLAESVRLGSKNAAVYVSYAYSLLNLGRFVDAKAALVAAAALAPNNADAFYMLGKACAELREPEAAERAWTRCFEISTDIEVLYCDFCLLLFSRAKIKQALNLMEVGAKHYPCNADIHLFLGNLHAEQAEYEAAVAAYQTAFELNPTSALILSNYGNALRQTGDLTLSIEMATRAAQAAPDSASILSNYLLGIQYSAQLTKEQKFDAHREYAEKFEAPLQAHWGNYQNSLEPGRKIRIGYVSGDFRNHSLAYFIQPTLVNHDKARFEVYGYYAYPIDDAATLRIQKLCDQWVNCHALSDEALAARVRSDQIDILIDLSGHTGHNRLLTFARKPAPIQMTWLGYQATTGLQAMDYRITEEALDPSGSSESFHSEKLLRLPSSGAFSPSSNSPPVNGLPALTSPIFTFGCLNNPSKITDDAVELWSQILIKIPASRLLIGYATPALIEKLSAQFSAYNVPPHQITFQPKVDMHEYLQLHHQIDLALDTFPYNGGTTTFHSLWMGVPILALEGDTALSKVGVSIMSGLGLSQFCCTTKQRYVDQAVALATQLPELAAVRLALRPQMAVVLEGLASSVTQNLENAFEKCWAEYREARLKELANETARQSTLN